MDPMAGDEFEGPKHARRRFRRLRGMARARRRRGDAGPEPAIGSAEPVAGDPAGPPGGAAEPAGGPGDSYGPEALEREAFERNAFEPEVVEPDEYRWAAFGADAPTGSLLFGERPDQDPRLDEGDGPASPTASSRAEARTRRRLLTRERRTEPLRVPGAPTRPYPADEIPELARRRRWSLRRRRARPPAPAYVHSNGPIRRRRRFLHVHPPFSHLRAWALLGALVISLAVAGVAAAALPGEWRTMTRRQRALEAGPRTVEATVATVRSTVVLDGVVVRQRDQVIKAPVSGTVGAVDVKPGEAVSKGKVLIEIDIPPAPIQVVPTPSPSFTFEPSPSPSPSPTPTPSASVTPAATPTASPTPSSPFGFPSPSPTPEVQQVAATLDATVSDVAVLPDQEVAVGQNLVRLTPKQLDVIAPLSPGVLQRFYQQPLAIQVAIPNGPKPFACAFRSIGSNIGTSGAQNVLHENPDLRCEVPTSVVVFPGLRGAVTVTIDQVDGVVTLPLRVIDVRGDRGLVFVVERGHLPRRQVVRLGLSDGQQVEILSGLRAGERVLDRPPGSPPP